jgi:hypothetical protein
MTTTRRPYPILNARCFLDPLATGRESKRSTSEDPSVKGVLARPSLFGEPHSSFTDTSSAA